MEKMFALRCARRFALVILFAGGFATLGVSGASARPGIGVAPRLPVAGPAVSLGCANPANHGLTGDVLAAAKPKAGSALRCLGQAIGSSRTGPELMSGPTGLGPSQIQSAYKLAGLNGV